jgi:hypothetical protein
MASTLPAAVGLLLATGCATRTYTLKTTPPEAEIALVNEKEPDKAIKTLGKGEAKLQGEDLNGKIYAIRGPNLQRILLVFPKANEDGVLTLSVPPADSTLQDRLAELESQLTAERRANADLKTAAEKRERGRHDTVRLAVTAQRHLALGSQGEAERLVADLFSQGEENLPAAAYTLRGKLRLTQNKRAEARADFLKAIALSDKESEAKALLESAK